MCQCFLSRQSFLNVAGIPQSEDLQITLNDSSSIPQWKSLARTVAISLKEIKTVTEELKSSCVLQKKRTLREGSKKRVKERRKKEIRNSTFLCMRLLFESDKMASLLHWKISTDDSLDALNSWHGFLTLPISVLVAAVAAAPAAPPE